MSVGTVLKEWRSGAALGLNEAVADRIANQAGGLVDAQLVHDMGPMGLRGLVAHPQEARDLFGRLPFGDELEHFAPSWGQGVVSLVRHCLVRVQRVLWKVAEEDAATVHFSDRVLQVFDGADRKSVV